MGAVPGATLVGAIAVASATSRGDIIYSSDVHDLEVRASPLPAARGRDSAGRARFHRAWLRDGVRPAVLVNLEAAAHG